MLILRPMSNTVFFTVNFVVAIALTVITAENLQDPGSPVGVLIANAVLMLALAPSMQRLMRQGGGNPERWWLVATVGPALTAAIEFLRDNYFSETANEFAIWVTAFFLGVVFPISLWWKQRHFRENRGATGSSSPARPFEPSPRTPPGTSRP